MTILNHNVNFQKSTGISYHSMLIKCQLNIQNTVFTRCFRDAGVNSKKRPVFLPARKRLFNQVHYCSITKWNVLFCESE